MTSYPLIDATIDRDANRGREILDAVRAVDRRWTEDPTLVAALGSLEDAISEHSDSGYVQDIEACVAAERTVVAAWLPLRDAADAERVSRYRD